MPAVTDTSLVYLCADFAFYNFGLLYEIFFSVHAGPLEWGKWFRYKERGTYVDLNFAVTFFFRHFFIIGFCDLLSKMSDTLHIILCFRRKSEHEVEFYLIPSTLECFSCTVKNVLFCQTFVDNVTQTLGTCFWCECQAALLDILYFAHNIQSKSVDTKRRQGDIDSVSVEFFD